MSEQPQKPIAPKPPGHETDPAPADEKPKASFRIAEFFMWLIIFAIIVAGAWYAVVTLKDKKTAPQTADNIRQTFQPPAGFSPSFVPPTPSPQTTPPPPIAQTPPPAPAPIYPNPSPTTASPRGPAVAGAQTPPASPELQRGEPAYNPPPTINQPAFVPYVESYPANNTSLEDIKQILQGSPSVKSVADTTYNGQPALQYTAQNPADSGVAYIANNTIYYVHNG
jgi:hypothetical protein